MSIRPAAPQDRAALLDITRAAFGAEELRPLVARLLELDGALCLVGGPPGAPEGYAFFTPCRVLPEAGGAAGGDAAAEVALLGPLAVEPGRQRRGLGSGLVHAGVARLAGSGAHGVLVLGDPAYYGRFGFEPTAVLPPFPLPREWAEAWRALPLGDTAISRRHLGGRLEVPPPWRDAALWSG